MTTTITMPAERREGTGKGPARALRRAEKVPGIVYGGKAEPLKIALPLKETRTQVLTNARFFSSVIELDFGDGGTVRVLPREAQLDPVSDIPLHIDFMRAERGAELTVAVAVRFVHEDRSPGLKAGGVLNIVRREVELVCPADAIPDHLTVDLAGVEMGASIHISHVELPAGVRPTITDRDFTIASIVPPTVAVEVADTTEGTETTAQS